MRAEAATVAAYAGCDWSLAVTADICPFAGLTTVFQVGEWKAAIILFPPHPGMELSGAPPLRRLGEQQLQFTVSVVLPHVGATLIMTFST